MAVSKVLQKTFMIFAGLSFLGMMTLPMLTMFNRNSNPAEQAEQTGPNTNEQQRLQQIAQGYEKVLEREPDNPTALQGLVSARLELRDLPGMVQPLEKLVELDPDNPQFQELLAAVKQQLALLQQQQAIPPQPSAPSESGTAQPLPADSNPDPAPPQTNPPQSP